MGRFVELEHLKLVTANEVTVSPIYCSILNVEFCPISKHVHCLNLQLLSSSPPRVSLPLPRLCPPSPLLFSSLLLRHSGLATILRACCSIVLRHTRWKNAACVCVCALSIHTVVLSTYWNTHTHTHTYTHTHTHITPFLINSHGVGGLCRVCGFFDATAQQKNKNKNKSFVAHRKKDTKGLWCFRW